MQIRKVEEPRLCRRPHPQRQSKVEDKTDSEKKQSIEKRAESGSPQLPKNRQKIFAELFFLLPKTTLPPHACFLPLDASGVSCNGQNSETMVSEMLRFPDYNQYLRKNLSKVTHQNIPKAPEI